MTDANGSYRNALLEYAREQYATQEEYLWRDAPGYAVLRHPCGKWYGVIMDVPIQKLGGTGEGRTDILVAKCEPWLVPVLQQQKGFAPAYHMNKQRWVTALLNGEAEFASVCNLLDMSYACTTPRAKSRRSPNE